MNGMLTRNVPSVLPPGRALSGASVAIATVLADVAHIHPGSGWLYLMNRH
jgi:hypothetical protein